MTLQIFDIATINLDCSLSGSTLDLLHDSNSLTSNGDSLFDELAENGNDDADIVVSDFDVSGSTHQAHTWEVLADGSLSKWSRGSANSYSGRRSAMDTDIYVVAVPPGVTVPAGPSTEGPPPPGTTQKKIRVKVEKQGGLPFH